MKMKFIFGTEATKNGQKIIYKAGDTYEIDDDHARKLINEGRAEPAKAAPQKASSKDKE
jgi:hypothetical protein